jgi:uncharacterized repeat protein (TIGR01451 family)
MIGYFASSVGIGGTACTGCPLLLEGLGMSHERDGEGKMMRVRHSAMVWVVGLAMLALLGFFVTIGFAQEGEGPSPALSQVGSATELTLQKESDVTTVTVGQSVVYTVTINNLGSVSDEVEIISDTLPSGFTFETMLDTGDMDTPPQVEEDTLIWDDPITIPPGERRSLVYQVRAGGIDLDDGSESKENGVEVRTIGGDLLGPEYATVRVDPIQVHVPLVTYSERPATTLPFYDDFLQEPTPPDWTVFLNYPGLTASDWYWDPGIYYYDPEDWRGYALSMYLGPGSEEWTDYEVVTTIRDRGEKLAGIWVRGTYEDEGDGEGGRVGGYYVFLRPQDDYVYLFRIRPDTQLFYDVQEVGVARYAPGIGTRRWYHLKVAVQGANIKVWLKEKGDANYVGLIDWTDPDETYMQGTVGFSAFRVNAVYDDISVTELPSSGQ